MRKALLAASVMALASTPAWALPSQAPSNGGTSHAPETTPVGPPSGTPSSGSNPGAANRSERGGSEATHSEGAGTAGQGGHRSTSHTSPSGEGAGRSEGKGEEGKAHRCKPHRVAYVAAGTLLSGTLTKEEGSNAYMGEVEVEVKRTNHHARADKGTTKTYTLEGVHVRGPVPAAEVAEGDRVRLIGKITVLPRRCEAGEFTPTIQIKRLRVHPPRTTTTTTTTSSTTSEEGTSTTTSA